MAGRGPRPNHDVDLSLRQVAANGTSQSFVTAYEGQQYCELSKTLFLTASKRLRSKRQVRAYLRASFQRVEIRDGLLLGPPSKLMHYLPGPVHAPGLIRDYVPHTARQ